MLLLAECHQNFVLKGIHLGKFEFQIQFFGGRRPSVHSAISQYRLRLHFFCVSFKAPGFLCQKLPLELIESLLEIKRASAMANIALHVVDEQKAAAIVAACEELIISCKQGKAYDFFPLSLWQSGSGLRFAMLRVTPA